MMTNDTIKKMDKLESVQVAVTSKEFFNGGMGRSTAKEILQARKTKYYALLINIKTGELIDDDLAYPSIEKEEVRCEANSTAVRVHGGQHQNPDYRLVILNEKPKSWEMA